MLRTCVAAALEAARRVGLEPKLTSIRGGTDGSRLTEQGLPTPNLFTGGNDYHSVREWISVEDMAISAATLVELLRALVRGEPREEMRGRPAGAGPAHRVYISIDPARGLRGSRPSRKSPAARAGHLAGETPRRWLDAEMIE